jgi:hypothetical protein
VALVLAGLLSGCATTVARQETTGISIAESPEYLAHPFRLVALGMHATGNVVRYTLIEPFYFLLLPIPDFVGLSLEEQQYLQERQDAWARWSEGNMAKNQIPPK